MVAAGLGGFLAGFAHGGQLDAESQAGGERGAEHSGNIHLQQFADAPGGIAFDIHQQEDHPFFRGETADSFLEFGAQDVVTLGKVAGVGRRQWLVLAEDIAVTQLFEEGLINDGAVGLLIFAKSADEGAAQELLGFELAPGHVIGDGKDAMAVTVVDVPLPLFKALRGHLPGRHFCCLRIEFEQHA
jgi:hypothetical protein